MLIAKSRNLLFPALLAVVAMAVTVGLRFLTGDGVIGANADEISGTFTFDELSVSNYGIPVFIRDELRVLGNLSFFLGGGKISTCLPSHAAIDLQITYLAYYLKRSHST